MVISFIQWRHKHKNAYICDWTKANNKSGRLLVIKKALGKITDEQAECELRLYSMVVKPIYRTIVIDPPWPIKKMPREVRPNQKEMDYKTMSLEQIKRFDLQRFVSEEGAHVYLWTTQKYLQDAFEVLKAWNANYQCLLTWIKNVGFTPFSWMYSTEFVLFGRIGNLALIRKGLRVDFKAKVREHSRKPDEFYDIVKTASPDPRIDIFSREKRDGFDGFGDETRKF